MIEGGEKHSQQSRDQVKQALEEVNDTALLLHRVSDELKSLRRRNEIMQARLDVFDACVQMQNSIPQQRGVGMVHPDVVYEIDKLLAG